MITEYEKQLINEATQARLISPAQAKAIRDLIKADGKKQVIISGQTNPDIFNVEIR